MDAQHIRLTVEHIIRQCGFNPVPQENDKLSQYYELRHKGKLQMSVIRLSNHCTNPLNWKNRYGNNNPSLSLTKKEAIRCNGNYDRLPNKCFKKTFFSFVIFDPAADGVQQCAKVQTDGIFVNQFIYDATKMTNGMIAEIKNKIKQIASNGILEEKIEKDNNTKTQNNMKRKIRLTEGELHRIIKKCINGALNEIREVPWEGDYAEMSNAYFMDDDDKNFFINNHTGRFNKDRLHTLNRQTDYTGDCMKDGDHGFYADATLYPSAKFSHPDWQWDSDYNTQDAVNYLDKKDFDKKMSDYKDRLNYSKLADSRPLHRKGSLNRAFDEDNNLSEGKLHKIIRRCVNEELKSKRY